jgi:hypothetical protein
MKLEQICTNFVYLDMNLYYIRRYNTLTYGIVRYNNV